jgi:hypothetical protein
MTAAILQQLKADGKFIVAITGPAGPAGKDGVNGKDGTNGSTPELPPQSTGWSHLVLIAPSTAAYWGRLSDEYDLASAHWDKIKHIEPPADRDIGPLPLLVAYRGGIPAKSWAGLRNVSEALSKITRSEFDDLFAGQ